MFHCVLADVGGIPEDAVDDGKSIATYAPSSTECVRVTKDSRKTFDKFLMTALDTINCQQTVDEGISDLIRLMVVK